MNKLSVFWVTDDDNVWTFLRDISKEVEFNNTDEAVEFAKANVNLIRDPMSEYLVVGWAVNGATAKDMPIVEKSIFLHLGKIVVE